MTTATQRGALCALLCYSNAGAYTCMHRNAWSSNPVLGVAGSIAVVAHERWSYDAHSVFITYAAKTLSRVPSRLWLCGLLNRFIRLPVQNRIVFLSPTLYPESTYKGSYGFRETWQSVTDGNLISAVSVRNSKFKLFPSLGPPTLLNLCHA